MQIVLNDDNVIIGFSKTGKIKNGVEFMGKFPVDIALYKYKWKPEPVEEIAPGEYFCDADCAIIIVNEYNYIDDDGNEISGTDSYTQLGNIIPNENFVEENTMQISISERLEAIEEATQEIILTMMERGDF